MNEPRSETWRKLVLRSMPPPAWLGPDAPDGDVVISSRVRYARNLRGFHFPSHAGPEHLGQVQRLIQAAIGELGLGGKTFQRMTSAERDYLLGARLISADFPFAEPFRVVILDDARIVSVMVNEEDHLRAQALTAGWSVKTAQAAIDPVMRDLSERLEFMHHDRYGFVTASTTNAGEARRRSALFHLIGLAHLKRLAPVVAALKDQGLAARGLYGEASRAVGAFFQVSATRGRLPELIGAAEYLMREERQARREVGRRELAERAFAAAEFAVRSQEISLADALRTLAWARWASAAGTPGFPSGARDVDAWVATMELHGTADPKAADRHRAAFLRQRLEGA